MADELPPPPPGFKLDQPQGAGAVPPPPAGFTLDQPDADKPQMGRMDSFGTGALNTAVNLAQTGVHALGAPLSLIAPDRVAKSREAVDRAVEARKARVAAANPRKGYEAAGEIAATAPALLVDAPVTMGALLGASGDTKPGADFWADKFKDMALGAVLGKGGDLVGKGIGKMVAPKIAPDAATLMQEGVTLTPGQMGKTSEGFVGKTISRAEDAFQSVPVLGSLIRNGRENALQRFNRVAIDRALDPIGSKLPPGIKPGHDAMEFMAKEIDNAYDKVAPSIIYKPSGTAAYQQDMQNIANLVSELHPDQAQQFNAIMKNRIYDRFKNGVMNGKDFIRARSDIAKMAREKLRGTDGNQQQLGHVLDEVQDALMSDLERVNPNVAGELSKAHQAYGASQTINRAAANRLGSDAIFTPKDLIKGQRTGMTKGAIAKGRGAMTEFAERAHRVMGDSVRDSGTPERQQFMRMLDSLKGLWGSGLGAGAAAAGAHAAGAGMVGAGLAVIPPALAALPYTKAGQAVLQKWMQMPGQQQLLARKIIEQAMSRSAPVAAGAAVR